MQASSTFMVLGGSFGRSDGRYPRCICIRALEILRFPVWDGMPCSHADFEA
jgi:hypothetical protein